MNTVKEAIFLQYGSTAPLTALRMEQQNAMWDAVMVRTHAPYNPATLRFAASLTAGGCGGQSEDARSFKSAAAEISPPELKHVPIRLMVPGKEAAVQAPISATDQEGPHLTARLCRARGASYAPVAAADSAIVCGKVGRAVCGKL